MAVKQGRVHDVFTKQIDGLRTWASKLAAAFAGGPQADWALPESLADRDLSSIAELHVGAFDRSEIDANYVAGLSKAGTGTGGDLSGLKLQLDFVAMDEQAFRSRHASLVRCFVHGHGRLWGHGQEKSVFDAVRDAATNLIAAGAGAGEQT